MNENIARIGFNPVLMKENIFKVSFGSFVAPVPNHFTWCSAQISKYGQAIIDVVDARSIDT